MRRLLRQLVCATAWAAAAMMVTVLVTPVAGQAPGKFGNLAEGPYNRLVIRGAMVIPGHGGPPAGPYDIVIEKNVIKDMIPFDPVAVGRRGATERATGDRIIDATGLYVMPGMIDLHMHIRQEPMEIEYTYYLMLANGVTGMVACTDRGVPYGMEHAKLSAQNAILAPRLIPYLGWGDLLNYDQAFLEDPANAPRIAREMFAKGARVWSNPPSWNTELYGAICKAVKDVGGVTIDHIGPDTHSVIQAVTAARLGLTVVKHHYGLAESALDRTVQDFPGDYNVSNENQRFRSVGVVWEEAGRTAKERLLNWVPQKLVEYGAMMMPTMVVYEASRDIERAASLPWHEKYTHQALVNWNGPNVNFHGAFHYDWTSKDEQSWYTAFKLWGELIYEFNKRGGQLLYGTDANYLFATPGFSNERELQIMLESGLHTLEVLKIATSNSAKFLNLAHVEGADRMGLVRPGYLADLIIVDGNPAYNLRFLYPQGALRVDASGQMIRTKGIIHTVKDGIVINNARLMEQVAAMVAKSKKGAKPAPMMEPFVIGK